MRFEAIKRGARLNGLAQLMGRRFHRHRGPGFFRRQFAADQQGVRHPPGHGFGAVCVNDADHHRHLKLLRALNGGAGELVQIVE